eukprot:ANDGO_08503.mRNA.1 hypothetical protein
MMMSIGGFFEFLEQTVELVRQLHLLFEIECSFALLNNAKSHLHRCISVFQEQFQQSLNNEQSSDHGRIGSLMSEVHYLLGWNLFYCEEYSQVEATFSSNRFLKLLPLDLEQEMHYIIGLNHFRRHDLELAKASFQQSEQVYAQYVSLPHQLLAGQGADAEHCRPQRIHWSCLLRLGSVYVGLGTVDLAVACYSNALQARFSVSSAMQFLETVLDINVGLFADPFLDCIQRCRVHAKLEGDGAGAVDASTGIFDAAELLGKLDLYEGICLLEVLKVDGAMLTDFQLQGLRHQAKVRLDNALAIFPLNGFVSLHFRCVRALCSWFRLCAVATGMSQLEALQSRFELLAPIALQLTSDAYRDLSRQILFDLAQLFEEWSKVLCSKAMVVRAIDAYGKFLQTFHKRVEVPRIKPCDTECLSPYVFARISRATMMLSLSNTGDSLRSWTELCLQEYQCLLEVSCAFSYCLKDEFAEELKLFEQQVSPLLHRRLESETCMRVRRSVFISDLPSGSMVRVFSFLSTANVVACAQVCDQWNSLSLNGALWRLQFTRLFPSAMEHISESDLAQGWYSLAKTRVLQREEALQIFKISALEHKLLESRLDTERELQMRRVQERLAARRARQQHGGPSLRESTQDAEPEREPAHSHLDPHSADS